MVAAPPAPRGAGPTPRPRGPEAARLLAGPTGGRTIGHYQCGGAAPRIAAVAADGVRRAACCVARRAARRVADRRPATHRPNGRIAAPAWRPIPAPRRSTRGSLPVQLLDARLRGRHQWPHPRAAYGLATSCGAGSRRGRPRRRSRARNTCGAGTGRRLTRPPHRRDARQTGERDGGAWGSAGSGLSSRSLLCRGDLLKREDRIHYMPPFSSPG